MGGEGGGGVEYYRRLGGLGACWCKVLRLRLWKKMVGGNDSLTGFSSSSSFWSSHPSQLFPPTHLPKSPVRPKFSSSIPISPFAHRSSSSLALHPPFSPLSELLQPKPTQTKSTFFIYTQISTTSKKVKQGFLLGSQACLFSIWTSS